MDDSRLEGRLKRAYEIVSERTVGSNTDFRTAAYEFAVERTLRAMELRGL
ncbi:MAG: hypothetical protein BMS9Abin01_0379 [Gammaproteobacteria bacterium]|nr:MAG: hypothetical protein BMS9Abin01_0379 [Gammaproteobacteria bacterium]